MIPNDWTPYHRIDDGELIGYLQPSAADAELVMPVTLFGHPLADEPGEDWWAEQLLEDLGLSYLAERWELLREDGTTSRVVISECSPEHVVVALAEFAQVIAPNGVDRSTEDWGKKWTLSVPTDRLRPA